MTVAPWPASRFFVRQKSAAWELLGLTGPTGGKRRRRATSWVISSEVSSHPSWWVTDILVPWKWSGGHLQHELTKFDLKFRHEFLQFWINLPSQQKQRSLTERSSVRTEQWMREREDWQVLSYTSLQAACLASVWSRDPIWSPALELLPWPHTCISTDLLPSV